VCVCVFVLVFYSCIWMFDSSQDQQRASINGNWAHMPQLLLLPQLLQKEIT